MSSGLREASMMLPVSKAPPMEQSPQQDYSSYPSGGCVCSADELISDLIKHTHSS